MGFDDGMLTLNGATDTFFPGQMLSGRLEFDQDKIKKFRGIYLEIKGFCKVHWTTSHSRKVGDRTEHYTVSHDSYEEYMNITIYLVGGKNGEHQINAGHHVFPFECMIPIDCPSSFEGSDGHVRYEIKAVVDRPWKFDQTKKISFRVNAPLDLNKNPYCKEPINMEFDQSYCCWCMSAGNSEVLVKVPLGGWCPKQVVPIEVAVTNNSTVELSTIRFQIKKKTTFHAHHEPDTRHHTDELVELKKGPVGGGTTRNWTVEMAIPDIDVPNLDRCRFIDIVYTFKVKIETSGCHEDDVEERPFFLGTIPVSTTFQPPLPTENSTFTPGITSYPNQPVITQPFPIVTPFNPPPIGIVPPEITPYPGPNAPYSGPNSPYPPPYPGNDAPYQENNPPYPMSDGNKAPYPMSQEIKAPYPTSPNMTPYTVSPGHSSPYSQNANPPYPTSPLTTNQFQNSPNTGSNTLTTSSTNMPYSNSSITAPYPNSDASVTNTNTPYPSTNSPYPSNTPYPTGVNHPQPNANVSFGTASPNLPSSGLKTGTFGFVGGKDGSSAPLLPQGGAPYPTSPYAAASAPSSAPDDDTKTPPFNPEYKS